MTEVFFYGPAAIASFRAGEVQRDANGELTKSRRHGQGRSALEGIGGTDVAETLPSQQGGQVSEGKS